MPGPVSHGSPIRPTSLALATACGVGLGFLPVDSLAFYTWLVLSVILPTNLVLLAISAVLFHGVAWGCEPLFHKLGAILLTNSHLDTTWQYLANMPIVPWTRFSNTTVLGGAVVGLVLFWPVFLFSLPLYTRLAPKFLNRLQNTRLYRWWLQNGRAEESIA